MNRITRALVVASTLAMALPTAFPEIAQATVDDQRREVERIVDELDDLHARADILAEDYAEAVDHKAQLDQEVAAAVERVAAKEAELSALRGDLSEVAVRAFTGSGTDVLGPLFSNADSYSEGLRRDQYSRVALSVGTVTTDDLDEFIADLDEERQNLEAKRKQVEELTVTIADKQRQTEERTAEYVQRRDQAQARLGRLIEEEEQRRAEAAFARLQAELASQQTAASGGGDGGNGGNGGGGNGAAATPAPATGGGAGTSSAPAPKAAPVVNVPAVSGLAGIAISAALNQQGVPYRYATSKPGVSFDCSGLTHYAWGQAGVYLPRNSRAQAAATPRVPAAAAQPGDLIFYYSPISHVGVYLGGGQLVHAPNSGTVVKVANVSWGKVTAVGRPG
jgi:cell wall-associated NlpC family hydrolase